jgi:hypothetical protein
VPSPVFKDVQTVLNTIIKNWETGNGAPADLKGRHGASFLWDTRDHLVAAQFTPRNQPPIPLIQPEVIGKVGHGQEANIVVDLVKGLSTPARQYPQMPFNGLDASGNGKYLNLNSPEVKTIIAWIEGGCLP